MRIILIIFSIVLVGCACLKHRQQKVIGKVYVLEYGKYVDIVGPE